MCFLSPSVGEIFTHCLYVILCMLRLTATTAQPDETSHCLDLQQKEMLMIPKHKQIATDILCFTVIDK